MADASAAPEVASAIPAADDLIPARVPDVTPAPDIDPVQAVGDPGPDHGRDDGDAPDDGRARIGRLADELLPALIARLSVSSLGELEIRESSWRIRLRRAPAIADDTPAAHGRSTRAGTTTAFGEGTEAGVVAAAAMGTRAASASQTARDSGRAEARSPAVGYYAPRDGLVLGQQVRAGDVLGHVDVLGVRQEVVSPVAGLVVRHLAEPGEAVEYGQQLVRIERSARAGSRPSGDSEAVAEAVAIAIDGGPRPAAAPAVSSVPTDPSEIQLGAPNGSGPDLATQ